MKSLLLKSAVIGIISLIAYSSAEAQPWKCRAHNARGQIWYGSAMTRAGASSNAMRFCVNSSSYARNCVLDWCTAGAPGPMPGVWQCNVNNARGQTWYGTGPTRSAAASNAVRFCSQGSVYARNCVVTSCFVR
jgi:hypothetical protein